jgi:hypothetical protein
MTEESYVSMSSRSCDAQVVAASEGHAQGAFMVAHQACSCNNKTQRSAMSGP